MCRRTEEKVDRGRCWNCWITGPVSLRTHFFKHQGEKIIKTITCPTYQRVWWDSEQEKKHYKFPSFNWKHILSHWNMVSHWIIVCIILWFLIESCFFFVSWFLFDSWFCIDPWFLIDSWFLIESWFKKGYVAYVS